MSARLAAPHSRTPRSAANHRPCFIRIPSLSRASPVGRRPLIWRRQKPCSNLPEGSADYLKRDRSQVETINPRVPRGNRTRLAPTRPPPYFDWTAEKVPEIGVWRRKNPGPLDSNGGSFVGI